LNTALMPSVNERAHAEMSSPDFVSLVRMAMSRNCGPIAHSFPTQKS